MQITSIQYKRCDLIKAAGRIDSATSSQLSETVNKIMDAGRYKIVLDMSDVEFISSAGLRILVNAQKSCKRYNRGEIALASVPQKIYAALDLAGFTSYFRIVDNVVDAVANL